MKAHVKGKGRRDNTVPEMAPGAPVEVMGVKLSINPQADGSYRVELQEAFGGPPFVIGAGATQYEAVSGAKALLRECITELPDCRALKGAAVSGLPDPEEYRAANEELGHRAQGRHR